MKLSPALALSLLAMWLLLNQTLAVGHVLLGAALGIGGALAYARLQAPQGRVRRRAGAIAALFWRLSLDILRSNVAVARIVLRRGTPRRTSAFVTIPLQLRHPGGLAVLACVFTATPGTAWAGYDSARNELTIHVLDLVDEQAWMRNIKQRYERYLREIFE